MKKILLFILILITVTLSYGQCNYQVCLEDTYGDGWNGNSIDIIVNGILIYDDLTLNSGYGPECHNLTINTGNNVVITFNATGDYIYECDFYLYDSNGTLVASGDNSNDINEIITCIKPICNTDTLYMDLNGSIIILTAEEDNFPSFYVNTLDGDGYSGVENDFYIYEGTSTIPFYHLNMTDNDSWTIWCNNSYSDDPRYHPDSSYTFVVNDTYGDGIYSNTDIVFTLYDDVSGNILVQDVVNDYGNSWTIPGGTLIGISIFSITPTCTNCLYDNGNGWAEFDPIQMGTYDIKYCWNNGNSTICCTKSIVVDTPLPVEFLNFDYDCSRKILYWETTTEINNDYFIIEIGNTFDSDGNLLTDEVYTVNGNGNTNFISEYSFNINVNNNYVRLSQVDYDGSTTILETKYINCLSDDELIKLYPNPATNEVNIDGDYKSIKIYDMSGREIYTKIINNKIIGLSTGMYIVVIDNHIKIKLIIKK